MKKRLVWNFEIDDANAEQFPRLPSVSKELLRWEARYFWDEGDIAELHGLGDDYLSLAQYEIKHRQDTYHLLPQHNANIKVRRGELLYKPLLDSTPLLQGFGKKLSLHEQLPDAVLPGTDGLQTQQVLKQVEQARTVTVEKEALIHKLNSDPPIKLELSRLKIGDHVFYSACIEGRAQALVDAVARHVFPGQQPSDYVRFLKQQVHYD